MVFQNNRHFMSSILRIDVEQKRNQWMKSTDKFFESIPVLAILFIMCSAAISNAVRMHNDSYDFTDRLAASLMLIAMSQAITIFLSMGMHMKTIVTLYRTLQAIVDRAGTVFLRFIKE